MPRWYRHRNTPITLDFIWSRVDKSGDCWIWLGSKQGKGYGVLRVGGGKRKGVHELVYALSFGPVPEGMEVCHTCDNSPCCRPDHLFAGTRLDNIEDMIAKGRNVNQAHPELLARGERNGTHTHPESLLRGEQNANASLTTEQVIEARQLYATGLYLLRDLAARFNMSVPGIHHAIRGDSWAHIPLEETYDDHTN